MLKRDLQFDEPLLAALHKADINCRNCRFWKQKTNLNNVQNSGDCTGLRSGEIEVFIQTYGDANIDVVETDEDFFCANFRYDTKQPDKT